MELQSGRAPYALNWKDFWFSCDTIIVEMTHLKNKKIIDQVRERISDFDEYYEHLLYRSYTIGSMVIFPVHVNSMNQRQDNSKTGIGDDGLALANKRYRKEYSVKRKTLFIDDASGCSFLAKDIYINRDSVKIVVNHGNGVSERLDDFKLGHQEVTGNEYGYLLTLSSIIDESNCTIVISKRN